MNNVMFGLVAVSYRAILFLLALLVGLTAAVAGVAGIVLLIVFLARKGRGATSPPTAPAPLQSAGSLETCHRD